MAMPVSNQAARKLPRELLRWAGGGLIALALSLMAAGSGPAQDKGLGEDQGINSSGTTEGLIQEPYQPLTQPHPQIENPVPDDQWGQEELEKQPPLENDPINIQPAERPTPGW